MDENDVLTAVDKIHDRLAGMAAAERKKEPLLYPGLWEMPRVQHDSRPPPDVHVALQGEEQVGQEPLVQGRPLELRDAEHGGARARAELTPLLLLLLLFVLALWQGAVGPQIGCARRTAKSVV